MHYAQLNSKVPADLMVTVKSPEDMDNIVDTLAVHLNLSFEERQEVLEIPDLQQRITNLCTFLQREIDILETEERIRGTIQKQVEKNQREYYLTEQMKAIQKELGRDDTSNRYCRDASKNKDTQAKPGSTRKSGKRASSS